MMKCPKCGYENSDGSTFCQECGERLEAQQTSYYTGDVNNSMPNGYNNNQGWQGNASYNYQQMNNIYQQTNTNYNNGMQNFSINDVFVEPTEKLIGSFGNNYLQSIALSRDCSQFAYLLTDRRLYFKGTGYGTLGKIAYKAAVEKIIDLEDITMTEFENVTPLNIIMLIAGGLTAFIGMCLCSVSMEEIGFYMIIIGVVIFVITLIFAIIRSATYFCVSSSGGKIMANIKMYSKQSAKDFQKQIRRAKDKRIGK